MNRLTTGKEGRLSKVTSALYLENSPRDDAAVIPSWLLQEGSTTVPTCTSAAVTLGHLQKLQEVTVGAQGVPQHDTPSLHVPSPLPQAGRPPDGPLLHTLSKQSR